MRRNADVATPGHLVKEGGAGFVEQRTKREVNSKGVTNLHDQLRAEQRVPAEQKEVIVDANFVHIE